MVLVQTPLPRHLHSKADWSVLQNLSLPPKWFSLEYIWSVQPLHVNNKWFIQEEGPNVVGGTGPHFVPPVQIEPK